MHGAYRITFISNISLIFFTYFIFIKNETTTVQIYGSTGIDNDHLGLWSQKSSKYLAEIVKTNIDWIFEYLDQMEGRLREQPTPAMSFLSNPVSGSAGEE